MPETPKVPPAIRPEDVILLREVSCCPSHDIECRDLADRLEAILTLALADVPLSNAHD